MRHSRTHSRALTHNSEKYAHAVLTVHVLRFLNTWKKILKREKNETNKNIIIINKNNTNKINNKRDKQQTNKQQTNVFITE